MEEEISYTSDIPSDGDNALSYAEDVPYEAQLPESTQYEPATSLKGRIGNRIYLLEDSLSKKRKLVDLEDDDGVEDDEVAERDADLPYRPNALLLQGPPITQIPTARVFAYATHFDAHPIGLEWVDDQTCVLVFVSRKSAIEAWKALRKVSHTALGGLEDTMTMEVEGIDEILYPAHPLPLALYPIEERINTVLGNKKSNALRETIQIRWARSTDVKERGARVRSQFYKRHGETAGKEGLPEFSKGPDEARKGNKRRKGNGDQDIRRQLDAELDVFLLEDETTSNSPATDKQDTKAGRSEDSSRIQEEKRRILDYELDSFLASGEVAEPLPESTGPDQEDNTTRRVPSLLERTGGIAPRNRQRETKPFPRRSRRGTQYEDPSWPEASPDGRWLHNAEIAQKRRKDDFDGGGSGMRAWASEPSRRPKLRKTQEELDRELEHFSRETH